ncbi:MAG TPA: DUF885 domain-containing protein [Candidatus Limnocylindrales bacterium]|nr:DUF885 domain-containing protein [Candidatus Limnocylindrales bacterium]
MTDSLSTVDDLAHRFWEGVLELNPTTATFYGDERYADRLEDPSPAGRARTRDLMSRTAAEAAAIPIDGLSTEERITRHMLHVIGELAIEEDDQGLYQLRVVDQMGGPQQLLPQLTQFQPVDTPERIEAFIGRLHAYPTFMAANADILREALGTGLTAPSIVTERVIAQIERMLAIPIESAIVPANLKGASDADRERVRDVVRDVVYPADAAFLETLRGEYRAASRTDPGIWSAPNGDAIYRTAIRSWTTLEMDPEEIHQIGLDEMASINEERREIARAAGFGEDIAAYRESLESVSGNTPATKDELVERAREDIDRAMAAAPRFFGVLPKAGLEVRPVEEYKERDAPFAYYYPPAADGSRDGIYYANGFDLPSRKYSKLASTTYHEAAPGHHFQIALEMENPDLNTFRRLGARMVGGAYVEGWGLYSERLADEMGLYRSEAERFGMLDGQAWRAARLVVDTGLHALRWERQRSIDFLRHDAGLSETDSVIETDRYICWPGQALTYMLGKRQIDGLRRELAARDGSRFDLRTFHDQVLGHGSLPLATLARELPSWVAEPV